MNEERWRALSPRLDEALAMDEEERLSWLTALRARDPQLAAELESLLEERRTVAAEGFLEGEPPPRPPHGSLAGQRLGPYAPGTRLGPYEVTGRLGAGGMGEVYRARDTQLRRDVALKVLPDAVRLDPGRLTRFEHEARVLASLNHPNIGAIYGVEESEGIGALVLELVEGDTLAARIGRGPIPVAESLAIARQIADALDAAHEKGIVHRDLKPANIAITPTGLVKVLDFGLAKIATPPDASSAVTASATLEGMLVGTAAYMSPEQARGQRVDKRTDIWAFGCVLYEMLTGRRLFDGDGTTDTLALLFTKDPDWSALPPQTPFAVRALLRRCLERDCVKRLGDVAAIRFALEDVAGANEQPSATTSGEGPRRWGVTWGRTAAVSAAVAAAALIVVIAIGLAVWEPEPSPEPSRPQHLAIPLPQGQRLAGLRTGKPMLAISPGERYIAYVATTQTEAARQIYLYSMESGKAEPVPGSVGAHTPFFAPDEEWLGFYSGQNTLLKIPVRGGVAERLADVVNPFGASWASEQRIVFASFGSVLQELLDEGSRSEALTRLEPGETMHLWPHLLPGGKAMLFSVASDTSTIAVQPLGAADRRSLIQGRGISMPHYSPSGHLVYAQAGSLRAVPFDPRRGKVEDGAVPMTVMSGVLQYRRGVAHFSVSAKGSLAYVPGELESGGFNLVRVSRDGTIERTYGAPPREYYQPRLTPDGRRVAMDVFEGLCEVWLYDLGADEAIPFTYKTEGDNRHPTWVGSKRIAFQSDRKGTRQIFWQLADGGAPEQLTDFPPPTSADIDIYSFPASSCRDELLTFVRLVPNAEGWVLHIGDSSGQGRKAERLDFPMSADGTPQFSPDCRWLAYVSDESGRREVWVRAFPSLGSRHLISTGGGNEPVWNPDPNKRELSYRNGEDMMAVTISDRGFAEGKAEKLFTGSYATTTSAYARPNYDVFPDGSFLMLKPVEQEQSLTQINVVLNWREELTRLVPID